MTKRLSSSTVTTCPFCPAKSPLKKRAWQPHRAPGRTVNFRRHGPGKKKKNHSLGVFRPDQSHPGARSSYEKIKMGMFRRGLIPAWDLGTIPEKSSTAQTGTPKHGCSTWKRPARAGGPCSNGWNGHTNSLWEPAPGRPRSLNRSGGLCSLDWAAARRTSTYGSARADQRLLKPTRPIADLAEALPNGWAEVQAGILLLRFQNQMEGFLAGRCSGHDTTTGCLFRRRLASVSPGSTVPWAARS